MNILNLPDWEVIEVKESDYDYAIHAKYSKEPEACIRCGVIGQLYRHGIKRQRFMDLPIHNKRVGLIAHRQRYHCRACKKTSFQPLPDMDKNHATTARLLAYIGKESMKRTFVSVADDTGIHERTVRRLFASEVARLEAEVKFETPRWLGIDEVHLVNRARCILTNVEQKTVIDMLTTRTKDVVGRYLYQMPNRNHVELVAMDMWQPYRDAVRDVLPQATVVIDRFHVIRLAIQGMDTVRKDTREHLTARQRRTLIRDRYILFHRRGMDSCGCAECQAFYKTIDLTKFGSRVRRYGDLVTIVAGTTGADLAGDDRDGWQGEVFQHYGKRYAVANLGLDKKAKGLYLMPTVFVGVSPDTTAGCGVATTVTDAVTASDLSKSLPRNFVTDKCLVCGKDLGDLRANSRYCSDKCRVKAYRVRKQERCRYEVQQNTKEVAKHGNRRTSPAGAAHELSGIFGEKCNNLDRRL